MDIALARTFSLTEKANFQFKAEAFNAFEQDESWYTEPVCERTPVWDDHDGDDTGTRIQLSARVSF